MSSGWGSGITFAFFVIIVAILWTEPKCREGFIPDLRFSSGWACVPGYKP
jgi:hypothetical protein